MFQRGDRFKVKKNGLRGTIDAVDSYYDSDEEIHEYHVIWDHAPGHSYSYMHSDVKDRWEKIDSIADQQAVGLDYAPADTNDRFPRGINSLSPEFIDSGVMPGESIKQGCDHKWVEVGFMHTKTVCYHCDMEKP